MSQLDFYYDAIVCPYCHGKDLPGGVFGHKDVHFRMETYFEGEEDLNDEGKTLEQIKRMPEGPAKNRLQEQVGRRYPFLCKADDVYEKFWEDFAGTTEEAYGLDKEELKVHPSQLPILDPSDDLHRTALKPQRSTSSGDPREDYFLYDGDGMVIGIEDIHGQRTYRRLCPSCHNPLPTGYGKFETKFISIIGVTHSGKTVYISQLLKYMSKYVNYVGMDSYFTSDHELSFVERNPVRFGEALPEATMAKRLSQPMYYDLVQNLGGGRLKTNTIVLYDIAGENCAAVGRMEKFGRFVTKSDGIILLLDPNQLGLSKATANENEKVADLKLVLNTIHGAFRERRSNKQLDVPMAVCISKSDMIRDSLPEDCRGDIIVARNNSSGKPMKKFNATAYNPLEEMLANLMRDGNGQEVHSALNSGYEHFNYFAFSATGCAVEERSGVSYPAAPPVPLRIAEPLLWLFFKFGYIGSDRPIRLPEQREYPETVSEVVKGPLPFMKKTVQRSLTEQEKDRYWYEPHT